MRLLNLTRQRPPDATWAADHARTPAILRQLAATRPLHLPAPAKARLLGYLVAVARQYRGRGVAWRELLTAGYLAAVRCCDTCADPARWAGWWVRQDIISASPGAVG